MPRAIEAITLAPTEVRARRPKDSGPALTAGTLVSFQVENSGADIVGRVTCSMGGSKFCC